MLTTNCLFFLSCLLWKLQTRGLALINSPYGSVREKWREKKLREENMISSKYLFMIACIWKYLYLLFIYIYCLLFLIFVFFNQHLIIFLIEKLEPTVHEFWMKLSVFLLCKRYCFLILWLQLIKPWLFGLTQIFQEMT